MMLLDEASVPTVMPELREKLKDFVENGYWYHTIDVADGLRTRGIYDHRPHIGKYGFPEILRGMSVLDVGTSDGFFAFELERRGASSVVAADTDDYDGTVGHTDISPSKYADYVTKYSKNEFANARFKEIADAFGLPVVNRRLIAASLLKSSVDFRRQSVYDLGQDGRMYDLVFCGDLIEHLKHPLGAIEKLRTVTGKLCIITLSSALPAGRSAKWLRRSLRRALRATRLEGYLTESSDALLYRGNAAGASFFHIHPRAFMQALYASGFQDVEIFSEFDLVHRKTGALNHHVTFHCHV